MKNRSIFINFLLNRSNFAVCYSCGKQHCGNKHTSSTVSTDQG